MAATVMPAMAGPRMRAPLNMAEFSAMALIRSSGTTISMMNAWRAGISNAFTTPSSAASSMISQTRMCPSKVSADRMKASNMEAVCVAMTVRCRL